MKKTVSNGFTTFSLLRSVRHERSLHERGFTLVELLVVITIMALVGTFTLSNYGSFGEDQKLKNAVLDIQSQLRTAQTNATTNVKCNDQYGASWSVSIFTSKTELGCTFSPNPIRSLSLGANIEIQSLSGDDPNCSSLPNAVTFAPLNGEMTLGPGCTFFTIALKNTKTGTTKDLKIEKGGRIYAE